MQQWVGDNVEFVPCGGPVEATSAADINDKFRSKYMPSKKQRQASIILVKKFDEHAGMKSRRGDGAKGSQYQASVGGKVVNVYKLGDCYALRLVECWLRLGRT